MKVRVAHGGSCRRSLGRGARGALWRLSILLPAVLAAGCSTRSELGFTTLMSEVPATRAAILPPPGGPSVVAVLQRTYKNGVSQEIALSTAAVTPGQNAFFVSLLNDPAAQSDIDDALKIPTFSQELVQKEMEERLPGIDMRTSLIYVQNKYGPFGFAAGRSSAGDVCLYAWQRIEPKEPAVLTTGGAVSVRLRLCDADGTVEQLLRTMYGFTISAYFTSSAWDPYGSPPPPPAQLGQIDAPLFPLGIGDPAGEVSSRNRTISVTRAVRSSSSPSRLVDKDTVAPPEAPSAPQAPEGNYPTVPPPPQ
jgi:hypothetical protein